MQEVNLSVDPSVTTVWADERRMKQMLVNLLSNAVKFTPVGGKIGLDIKGDWSNKILSLTVWDTGIGISSENLTMLFKPFVQLDSSLARSAQGTGLGLVLVSQMARLHGGSVNVESEPGRGSRFTISIPWVAGKQTGALKPEVAGGIRPQTASAPENAPTILIVEDTESVSMLIADYLTYHGYRVITAGDGFTGLDRARESHPDIILMDVMMPEMDGLETTRRIRLQPGLEQVPIIALTALAMPGDRERCIAAGLNDYVSKPVKNQELLQTIEKYVSAKAGDV
jgi:CheY-like chemotaxis protein